MNNLAKRADDAGDRLVMAQYDYDRTMYRIAEVLIPEINRVTTMMANTLRDHGLPESERTPKMWFGMAQTDGAFPIVDYSKIAPLNPETGVLSFKPGFNFSSGPTQVAFGWKHKDGTGEKYYTQTTWLFDPEDKWYDDFVRALRSFDDNLLKQLTAKG